MALLENHLEQISLSARGISELPFPPPKIFTNALLGNHEITTLIRDTEPHERALFIPDPNSSNAASSRRAARGATGFLGDEIGGVGRPIFHGHGEARKQSAVTRILGGDMLQQIQRSSHNATRQKNGRAGGADLEVLLRGAERLCEVYLVAGAPEKIASLRNRHKQINESITHYEDKLVKQTARLDRMNKNAESGAGYQDTFNDVENLAPPHASELAVTEEDIKAEEEEIRDLELKKRALEERVTGMEKDLGGLLR